MRRAVGTRRTATTGMPLRHGAGELSYKIYIIIRWPAPWHNSLHGITRSNSEEVDGELELRLDASGDYLYSAIVFLNRPAEEVSLEQFNAV